MKKLRVIQKRDYCYAGGKDPDGWIIVDDEYEETGEYYAHMGDRKLAETVAKSLSRKLK